uniref:Uncharacterized protein n=1 Tax=Anopheles culicifacies TaxID=139723 RepID=A0A182LV98_9DIPT
MKITCLRYLYTLPRLPLDALDMMMLGLSIRFFAITEYSTTSIKSGMMKNSTILPTKKDAGQKLSTGDRQAATMLPSMYSTYSYDEIIKIGLQEHGKKGANGGGGSERNSVPDVPSNALSQASGALMQALEDYVVTPTQRVHTRSIVR